MIGDYTRHANFDPPSLRVKLLLKCQSVPGGSVNQWLTPGKCLNSSKQFFVDIDTIAVTDWALGLAPTSRKSGIWLSRNCFGQVLHP